MTPNAARMPLNKEIEMRDYVHEHFAKHKGWSRPPIKCADGYGYSVQASEYHYCEPRVTGADEYQSVEVWGFKDGKYYPNEPEAWVSVEKMNARIHKHGGPL